MSISAYAYQPASITITRGTKVTLTNRGTYTYYCQFHPFVRGTVIAK